jgi:hypothetical protein
MTVFVTGCGVLMILYWVVLLALLYYTRNHNTTYGTNDTMVTYNKFIDMDNNEDKNEDELNHEHTNNAEIQTERETPQEQKCDSEIPRVNEDDTKKEK